MKTTAPAPNERKYAASVVRPAARSRLLQRKCACGGTPGFDGECAQCRQRRLQRQRSDSEAAQISSVPKIVPEVLNSAGQPLDRTTRTFMEQRFGHSLGRISVYPAGPQAYSENITIGSTSDPREREADAQASRVMSGAASPSRESADFSQVRIHTGTRAAESAEAVGAQAYAVGNNVVFGNGKYSRQTSEGRTLLAHELTHVLQQTGSESASLRRQPKPGEKDKPDASTAKFVGCDKDRLTVVQGAIAEAATLAARAVFAFERDFPLTYEQSAMTAHFGSIANDQKSKIIERYKHVISNLNSKTYTCAASNKSVREGGRVVDVCGEASCPGDHITIFPDFGKATCPAGPVMLHEALHNTGACDDINKGTNYPPSSSEDNSYSYEYFALAVTAGYKTPELKKRDPKAPR